MLMDNRPFMCAWIFFFLILVSFLLSFPVNVYCFSIYFSTGTLANNLFSLIILADGLGTQVNEKGIAYYNNVINFLLEKGFQLPLAAFAFTHQVQHLHTLDSRYPALCYLISLGSSTESSRVHGRVVIQKNCVSHQLSRL